MKYYKSIFSMAAAMASVFVVTGCVAFKDSQPKALIVGILDATSDKAKYVAQSPNGSVIRVRAAQDLYRESVHGRIRLDGTLPTHALTEFRVSIDGVNMEIPTSEYTRIGDPHIGSDSNPLKIECSELGLFYVYLSGSDGAGSHHRRFVFSKHNWIRTEFRN